MAKQPLDPKDVSYRIIESNESPPRLLTLDFSLEEIEENIAKEHLEYFENGRLLIEVAQLVTIETDKYGKTSRENIDILDHTTWEKYSSREHRNNLFRKGVQGATKIPAADLDEKIRELDRDYFGLASTYTRALSGDPQSIRDLLLAFPRMLQLRREDSGYNYFFNIKIHTDAWITEAIEARLKGNKERHEEVVEKIKVLLGFPRQKTIMVPDFILLSCLYDYTRLHKRIQEEGVWDEIAYNRRGLDLEKIEQLRIEAEDRIKEGFYGQASDPGEVAEVLTAKAFSIYKVSHNYMVKLDRSPWKKYLKL